jgi:hypothetical protein
MTSESGEGNNMDRRGNNYLGLSNDIALGSSQSTVDVQLTELHL